MSVRFGEDVILGECAVLSVRAKKEAQSRVFRLGLVFIRGVSLVPLWP